jgi:hypothetical protein
MNQQDRDVLVRAISVLRCISVPTNPADIKGHVLGLLRPQHVAEEVASAIENCGYGDYDLAEDDVATAESRFVHANSDV